MPRFSIRSLMLATALVGGGVWLFVLIPWSRADRIALGIWAAGLLTGIFVGRLRDREFLRTAWVVAVAFLYFGLVVAFSSGFYDDRPPDFNLLSLPLLTLTALGAAATTALLLAARLVESLCRRPVQSLGQLSSRKRLTLVLCSTLAIAGAAACLQYGKQPVWRSTNSVSLRRFGSPVRMCLVSEEPAIAVLFSDGQLHVCEIGPGELTARSSSQIAVSVDLLAYSAVSSTICGASGYGPELFFVRPEKGPGYRVFERVSALPSSRWIGLSCAPDTSECLAVCEATANERVDWDLVRWDVVAGTPTDTKRLGSSDSPPAPDSTVFPPASPSSASFCSGRVLLASRSGRQNLSFRQFDLESRELVVTHRWQVDAAVDERRLGAPEGKPSALLSSDGQFACFGRWCADLADGTLQVLPGTARAFVSGSRFLILSEVVDSSVSTDAVPQSLRDAPVLSYLLSPRRLQGRIMLYDVAERRVRAASAWTAPICDVLLWKQQTVFVISRDGQLRSFRLPATDNGAKPASRKEP